MKSMYPASSLKLGYRQIPRFTKPLVPVASLREVHRMDPDRDVDGSAEVNWEDPDELW